MAAIVRIFTHSALVTAPVSPGSARFSSDSVGMLKQPPEGREKLTATTGSTVESDASIATTSTKLLLIQVQPGKSVHYEVSPPNFSLTVASDTSPVITGDQIIQFGGGWRISFMENTDG